jgi:hypothetical protein
LRDDTYKFSGGRIKMIYETGLLTRSQAIEFCRRLNLENNFDIDTYYVFCVGLEKRAEADDCRRFELASLKGEGGIIT